MSTRKRYICCFFTKGVQIIALVSFTFGFVLVLGNCYLLIIDFSELSNSPWPTPSSADYNSSGEVEEYSVGIGNQFNSFEPAYVENPWTFPISICQMLSSFFLIFLRGRRYAQFWVSIQLIGVFYFIWNIPTIPPAEDFFTKCLFTIATFNFCANIFMLLIMVEFLVHSHPIMSSNEFDWS